MNAAVFATTVVLTFAGETGATSQLEIPHSFLVRTAAAKDEYGDHWGRRTVRVSGSFVAPTGADKENLQLVVKIVRRGRGGRRMVMNESTIEPELDSRGRFRFENELRVSDRLYDGNHWIEVWHEGRPVYSRTAEPPPLI